MEWGSSRRAGGVLVDELASSFGKSVHLKDYGEQYLSDSDDYTDEEEDCEDIQPYGPELVKNSASGKTLTSLASSDEDDDNDEPEAAVQLLFSEESASRVSLPLLSAIKGSREKQGLAPRNPTVTWAPDVYDPVPDSLCYATKTKQKKSRKDKDIDEDENNYKKKNAKKGQKGNSTKGFGGKDKKQYRKQGGRSDKCYRSMSSEEDYF